MESPNQTKRAINLKTEYALLQDQLSTLSSQPSYSVTPSPDAIATARASLPPSENLLPAHGLGAAATLAHVRDDILPALTGHTQSSRYYGFVTGSVLPVAQAADNIVSALDQNVQVYLPDQPAAAEVEDAALRMVCDLLRLDAGVWNGRTFTTGATASNILGLATGREHVITRRLPPGAPAASEVGLLAAAASAGVSAVQVLTSAGHSSLAKAASVVGLGRGAVVEVGVEGEPWKLDIVKLENLLWESASARTACIISVSAGEVNTGRFAVDGMEGMRQVRDLADLYGAWVHVDGAFGLFARALPELGEFAQLRGQLEGVELADSITLDGHKLLNVPYDCGIFLTRHAHLQSETFANANAAYLSSSATAGIPSPLNIGLENSRRFRALPVYAVLRSEGRAGIASMFARMVRLARKIANFIQESEEYVLLPGGAQAIENTHIIVLFRAKSEASNEDLAARISASREMYASGTVWEGKKAVRLAVSSWMVDIERDFVLVKKVLTRVAKGQ